MSISAATDLAMSLLHDQPDKWDQPNRIYTLHRTPLGVLHTVEVPVPSQVAHQDPVVLWMSFVRMVSLDVLDISSAILGRSGPGICPPMPTPPVGTALVVEAWQAPESHYEEISRRQAAGGSVPRFSELPGRKEVRIASVCVGQDVGAAQDIRGEGKRRVTSDSANSKLGGRLVDSLTGAARDLATLLGDDKAAARALATKRVATLGDLPFTSTQRP